MGPVLITIRRWRLGTALSCPSLPHQIPPFLIDRVILRSFTSCHLVVLGFLEVSPMLFCMEWQLDNRRSFVSHVARIGFSRTRAWGTKRSTSTLFIYMGNTTSISPAMELRVRREGRGGPSPSPSTFLSHLLTTEWASGYHDRTCEVAGSSPGLTRTRASTKGAGLLRYLYHLSQPHHRGFGAYLESVGGC